ncbi:MAG TPA: EAL domain-containing protein [Planctomycetes bacterium]|nr:EAL domain-containing protein [Planctomycetota bacterium]
MGDSSIETTGGAGAFGAGGDSTPTERELRDRLETTWAGARDGLWDWDVAADLLRLSPRWKEIVGYGPDEIPDRSEEWFRRVHPRDLDEFKRSLDALLAGRSPELRSEFRMLHKDGSWRWILCHGSKHGGRELVAGSITDVTGLKQRENEVLIAAFHDPLTGLPNRRLFLDRLQSSLTRQQARGTRPLAVLHLDLDRFHTVNDSLGVDAGDELLVEVTQRITSLLRLGDTLARVGGDKFAILLDGVANLEEATGFADEVVAMLRRPLRVAGTEVFASGSLGIALSHEGEERPEDLLRNALTAMHLAKEDGATPWEVFDPGMNEEARERMLLETDLYQATKNGEFLLHYQPIIDFRTGELAAFEALVRWQHPDRGLIRPDLFVSIAEDTGLILPMGNWVLREACRQMREWRDRYPASSNVRVAVNLSARQLEDTDLVAEVEAALADTGLDPDGLDLEVTESSLMARTRENKATLHALRDLGIKLHIDDFGTGYSSLAHLQSFPVDCLKVDRSFVNGMEFEEGKAEIVRTVLALARTLGMEVVAEGIETEAALEMLRSLECEHGQGYFFSSPLDGESAAAWLDRPPRW